MRYAIALLLLGHGIAHLPGFLGTLGARMIGTGWLVLATAFVALAGTMAFRWDVWPGLLPAAVAVSMLLCLLGWPEARIGLAVNGAVALGLIAARLGGG